MSLFEALAGRILWWRAPPESDDFNHLQNFLCRWEKEIHGFQRILVWQNPALSLIYLIVLNVFFWVMATVEWRFYGFVFLSLLVGACVEYLRHHGLIESSRGSILPAALQSFNQSQQFKILTIEELHDCIRSGQSKARWAVQRMHNLREDTPATFCVMACGWLVGLGMLGRAVSATTLLYTVHTAMMTLPALFVRYPHFVQYLPTLAGGDEVEAEESYLPQATASVLKVLDDESPDECSTSRAVPENAADCELYPNLDTMPSCDHSVDYLEPDLDIPSPRQLDAESEGSDLSETHELQDLQFKSKHFKEGSSSSSGEELSKGLRFRQTRCRQSSTDSDQSFELVYKDDL